VVELRYGEVEIRRPRGEDRSLPAQLPLRLVEVKEVDPPEGVEALHWRLLTTHHIADEAAGWQIAEWYQQRWIIDIDQAWRLSRLSSVGFGRARCRGDRRRQAAPRRGRCAYRSQRRDCRLIGVHQRELTTTYTNRAAAQASLLNPGVEGGLRHRQMLGQLGDRPFVRSAFYGRRRAPVCGHHVADLAQQMLHHRRAEFVTSLGRPPTLFVETVRNRCIALPGSTQFDGTGDQVVVSAEPIQPGNRSNQLV
jgi:hypothetical protein